MKRQTYIDIAIEAFLVGMFTILGCGVAFYFIGKVMGIV